MTEQVCGVDYL